MPYCTSAVNIYVFSRNPRKNSEWTNNKWYKEKLTRKTSKNDHKVIRPSNSMWVLKQVGSIDKRGFLIRHFLHWKRLGISQKLLRRFLLKINNKNTRSSLQSHSKSTLEQQVNKHIPQNENQQKSVEKVWCESCVEANGELEKL